MAEIEDFEMDDSSYNAVGVLESIDPDASKREALSVALDCAISRDDQVGKQLRLISQTCQEIESSDRELVELVGRGFMNAVLKREAFERLSDRYARLRVKMTESEREREKLADQLRVISRRLAVLAEPRGDDEDLFI